jgi:TAP-like protein
VRASTRRSVVARDGRARSRRAHRSSRDTVILDGGTLLDIPFYSRFAVNGERALADIARRCAAERACARAFPRWRAQLASLIRIWNAHPVHLRTAGPLSGDGLAGVVQQMTLSSEAAAAIPLVVSRAARGDRELLSMYVASGGLTRSVMFWAIWCNEPWVGLDAHGPWHTYLDGWTTAALAQYRAVCSYFPRRVENPSDWKRPRSSVPLLALVGGADPQDPVENLAGLRRAMPASRIIVVPGQGHTIGQYGCLGELVARFIDRGSARTLDTRCTRGARPPAFALG